MLSGAALLSLTGCAVTPPPSMDESITSALPEETVAKINIEQAASTAQEASAGGWVATFGDPELEAIVREAIENNLNLQAAVAKVDAAAGYARQAGAELQPAVGLGGQGLARDGFAASAPGLNASGVALNMSWELDLWGRVRSQAQAGEVAFEGAQYQLEWAYQSIAAQTAKMWFLVTEALLQEALVKEAGALFERTLGIVEAKRDQGQVTRKEVALARSRVASSQAAVRGATSAREQAVRGLELMLGRYPDASLEGAESFVAVPPPVPGGMPSSLLERRPDVRAAERAVAAQFLQIQTAQAARLPRIALTASVGTSSGELTDIVSIGSDYWSIGANFVAPLLTGGALEAQVDIETAQQKEALANFGFTALKAFAEVEQGLSNETLLSEQESFLAAAVEDAQEALRIAQDQFDVGKIDLLSVLQQQGDVIAAKSALINIRDQRLQQRVDLHLALGGGFD